MLHLRSSKKKLPGFTIVESIIALVIILVSFGIGMLIYLNIISSEQISASSLAHIKLAGVLAETKKEQSYTDKKIDFENIIIIKKISPYSLGESTYQIHLSAFDHQNKLLAEINEIIYLPISQD